MLEAPPRLELGNKGFADLRLTTWLWRRAARVLGHASLALFSKTRLVFPIPSSLTLSVKSLLFTDKEGLRSVVRRRVYPGGKRSDVNPDAGAVDETRTRDLNLGKVALYQLSYYRRFLVPWGGIEPPTRRFSVYCSTD